MSKVYVSVPIIQSSNVSQERCTSTSLLMKKKNEFVKKCYRVSDGSVAPTLDTNKEYNVLVGELEVVE